MNKEQIQPITWFFLLLLNLVLVFIKSDYISIVIFNNYIDIQILDLIIINNLIMLLLYNIIELILEKFIKQ